MNETIDIRTLRIGNILAYMGKLVHVTLLSMDIDDEYQETIGFCELGKDTDEKSDWNRALYLDLKPIPLTPEWLERCGFALTEDEEGVQFYSREDCLIYFQAEAGSDKFEQVNPLLAYKLMYVHQLQNLYFSLCGIELQINPL